MQTILSVKELRTVVSDYRSNGKSISFVPTMGNLHQGHISLVDEAHKVGDVTIVSIFVNPLQFGENEDIDNYPRTIDADSKKLVAANTDLLFLPTVSEVYTKPIEQLTKVEVPNLSHILCGEFRPGHFSGVATVVTKLFNMVQPHCALFGEKDYQQLLVIKTLVEDLNLPIEIVSVPTTREENGLAMSSRNQYLSESERQKAAKLYEILANVKSEIIKNKKQYAEIEQEAISQLKNLGFNPDYVSIRDASTLRDASTESRNLRILAAAWLGKARLIDNIKMNL